MKFARIIYLIFNTFICIGMQSFASNGDERLPEIKLKEGIANLNVIIDSYEPQDSLILKLGSFIPFGKQEYLNLSIPVDENGIADAEIDMAIPQLAYLRIGDLGADVLLAPGETVDVLINKSNDKLTIDSFKGYMSQTNTDINSVRVDDSKSSGVDLMTDLKVAKDPEERIRILHNEMDNRKSLINQMEISEGAKAILRMSAESEFLYWLNNFGVAFIGRQVYLDMIPLPPPDEYGEVIEKTNALLPAPPEGSIGTTEYFELLGAPYAGVMNDFGDYCSPDSVYTDQNGKPNLFNRDLYLAKEIIEGKSDYSQSFLLGKLTDPEIKVFVESVLEKQRKKAEELSSKENIYCHTYDEVAPDEILNRILGNYKDKNVVLDIWATWCTPCLIGHEQLKKYKEEIQDQDVVFVYITSTTSPLSLWENMIADISGEHYYLTSEQVESILKNYDSTGYPTYAIYDKTGNLIHKQVGYSGLDKMKNLINEVIGK